MYATIRMFCMLISMNYVTYVEIQFNSSRPNPKRREKIELNFYFNTTFRNAWGVKSLWFKTSQLHKFVRNGGKNLGPSQDGFFSIKLTKIKKKTRMKCLVHFRLWRHLCWIQNFVTLQRPEIWTNRHKNLYRILSP